jgi:Type IV secretion system pilin
MKIKLLTILFILITVFAITPAVQADSPYSAVTDEFNYIQEGVTGTSVAPDLENVIVDIIKIVLGFLGIIFVILIIWSGFQWMTAGGNSTAIEVARKRIINSVIGLVIILAAYSITSFAIQAVYNATNRGLGSECETDADCGGGSWTCEEINGEKRCVF